MKYVVQKINPDGKEFHLAYSQAGLEWVGGVTWDVLETDNEFHFRDIPEAEKYLERIGREDGCKYRIYA